MTNDKKAGMRKRLLSGFALLLVVTGCAYSTHNALPAHAKSIAVPMFRKRGLKFEASKFLSRWELKQAAR